MSFFPRIRIWHYCLMGIVLFIVVLFFCLPTVNIKQKNTISYYDNAGNMFYQQSLESGVHLYEANIPETVKQVTLSLEDKRFYYHMGFDPLAIMRALIQNIEGEKVVSGGSGITQQLVRNILKPKSRGVTYKMYEMLLALKLEMIYSKDEILTAYLNSIFYGENAYGIASAAKVFFNKSVSELSLREMVFLSGLPQSPSIYSPFKNISLALGREKTVESILRYNGFFATHKNAKQLLQTTPLELRKGIISMKHPHYIQMIQKELKSSYCRGVPLQSCVQGKNIHVQTFLNDALQTSIESLVLGKKDELAEKNINNAAVVVMHNDSMGVNALIGNIDYLDTEHQGAVNNAISLRQAGSTLKPFTYALAFEKGASPESLVDDTFFRSTTSENKPYEPKNYDFNEYGTVSMRQALANSYNISAVRVLQSVGVDNLLERLRRLGFSHLEKSADYYGLALTLGDAEVSLLGLTHAYSVLSHDGKMLPYHFIKTVSDEYQVYTSPSEDKVTLFTEQPVQMIRDILSDNFARIQQFGDDSPLKTVQWSAVKTGTTRNYKDNWTVGFDPCFLVGVWVGNSDARPMRNSTGVTGAAPIWNSVMQELFQTQSHMYPTCILQKQKEIVRKKKAPQPEGKIVTHIASDSLLLLSPQNGDTFTLTHELGEALTFKATEEVKWYIDDIYFKTGKKVFWENLETGRHCVRAESALKKEKACFTIHE